jgi:uncharacterized membrane protein YkgB
MYILSYADSLGIELSPWYLTALSVASISARVIFLIGNDYTFEYNRAVFQASVLRKFFVHFFCYRPDDVFSPHMAFTNSMDFELHISYLFLVSGILWIILIWAETYGWLLVWSAAMGISEGIIVCIIPRVTLVTIPRKWLGHSWGWILWFHAVGLAVMTIFVAVVA